MTDWNCLPEPLQLHLAAAALQQASENLACCAEALADEMHDGSLSDRGGQEALRLFAAIVRTLNGPAELAAGHA